MGEFLVQDAQSATAMIIDDLVLFAHRLWEHV